MTRATLRRLALALSVVALVGIAIAGTLAGVRQVGFAQAAIQAEDFYVIPPDLAPGEPGDLIASESLPGAPIGAQAWRIMYHSTDANGDDIPVTGIVVTPNGVAPSGGRTVIAWAHPTTGADPSCAPSLAHDPFELLEGSHSLLTKGFTIVATDYAGMGLDTPSAYLVGATEAHNVLDSVRAAQQIPAAQAGSTVVLWGHSQGGQAALFAEQLHEEYAPELDVRGVAVAAPAADLATLLDDDLDDISGVSIGSYAFTAYAEFYGEDIATILTPAAEKLVPQMVKICLTDPKLHELGTPLIGDFVSSDPSTTAPWDDYLARNTPDPGGAGLPLFIAQGLADELVDPSSTAQFVTAACATGRSVTSHTLPGVNHGFVAELSIPSLTAWLDDLGRTGPPASTGCDAGPTS
jgi:pimeloyl-ACP methyl ester carboxylesterase